MPSNFLHRQAEVIAKEKLPFWGQAKFGVAMDIIDRSGNEQKMGERDFRLPFETTVGGRFGIYSPDSGDMGRGTASRGNYMTGSYKHFRLNFELPHLAIKATENKEVSPKGNAFKDAVKRGADEMAKYLDKIWHSDGTAVLGTATAQSTVSSKTVYTMDNISGVQKFVRFQYVQPYANDLSAVKGSPVFIEQIDYTARQVYLSATVGSAASTDKLCIDGTSGASPVGMRGLQYWNNYATSGSTAGITRADELEIVSSSVNAGGGLTHEHGMALYHKILLRRGEVANDLVGLANVHQQAAVFADQMSLQTFDISGGNSFKDRLPKGLKDKSFLFANVAHFVDIHQDFNRIDWTPKTKWTKCILGNSENALKFFEVPGSGQRFFSLYGASGAPAAAVWFGLTSDMDTACTDPGAGGVIYGLTFSSLY
jgi:hypothetical protein